MAQQTTTTSGSGNNSNTYNPPLNFPMVSIPLHFEADVIKQVIGRDGCYFKQITEQTGVKYIWHHRDTHMVEVWGPEQCLSLAVSSIQYRVYMTLIKMARTNQPLQQTSINWLNNYHAWYQSIYMNQNFFNTYPHYQG